MEEKKVYEGWGTFYDETNNFVFDKALFLYSTQMQADMAAMRGSEADQRRLIGGRARRVRIEVLE